MEPSLQQSLGNLAAEMKFISECEPFFWLNTWDHRWTTQMKKPPPNPKTNPSKTQTCPPTWDTGQINVLKFHPVSKRDMHPPDQDPGVLCVCFHRCEAAWTGSLSVFLFFLMKYIWLVSSKIWDDLRRNNNNRNVLERGSDHSPVGTTWSPPGVTVWSFKQQELTVLFVHYRLGENTTETITNKSLVKGLS